MKDDWDDWGDPLLRVIVLKPINMVYGINVRTCAGGQEIELPEGEARAWIQRGWARLIVNEKG